MADAHLPSAKAKNRAVDSGKDVMEDSRRYYPDGGWGWMVVFGSFMIHVIADGIAYSFGVFVEDLKDYFDCSSADVGMIGSLMLGFTWGTGELVANSMLCVNPYGYGLCQTWRFLF